MKIFLALIFSFVLFTGCKKPEQAELEKGQSEIKKENFHIAPSTEKSSFTTSQQKMFSLITDNTEYNYTTTVTLWNLTSSQLFADRVNATPPKIGRGFSVRVWQCHINI